jgi:hypothetical protein
VLSVSDLNSPLSTSKPIIGLLPLNAATREYEHDFITLSFSFRFVNNASVTAAAANFRFGIFNSTGTPVTSDSQTTSDNDRGYYVTGGKQRHDGAKCHKYILQRRRHHPADPRQHRPDKCNGEFRRAVIKQYRTSTRPAFTLTRVNATAISLSLVIDGGTAITGTDTTANLRTSFDEIAFSNGFTNPGLNYAIDNVVISSSVPEPNTVGIVTAGTLVGAAVTRRRSSRPA